MSSTNLPAEPFSYFQEVFEKAGTDAPFDRTAMVLATASTDGKPSSRVVLLKNFGTDGFTFFTNYESHKGRELAANPAAALCLYWPWINVQVRIEGQAVKVSEAESDTYFQTRARVSQCGAIASLQSQPLSDRQTLIAKTQSIDNQYKEAEIPRPKNWGGFLLKPNLIEFWHDGEFRLHDRFEYRLLNNLWTVKRLYP